MKTWTSDEDTQLTTLYATEASVREIATIMGRTKPSIKNRVHTLGLKKPEGITNAGRFVPGQKSWNKGKKGIDMGGRSHETRFKPGHRGGKAAELLQPIGAERIVDGYLQRKVNDDMPLHKRWKFVHLIVWEQVNGPVPDGHVIVFRNKDRSDIRIENMECITRRELMARNTVHNYPEELRQVIRLKGAISKRITTLSRKEQQS